MELLALSVVGTSTSRPNVEGTPLQDTAKSKYDNVFSTPFLGSQLTVSPKFGELEGNYRLYGWYAGYNHSKLDSDRNPIDGRKAKGWGIGISADQQVTPMIGLFGRFGWNNDDVYVVGWEASGGVNLKGLIPGRSEDNLGVGFAALTPGDRYSAERPGIPPGGLLSHRGDREPGLQPGYPVRLEPRRRQQQRRHLRRHDPW